LLYRDFLRYVEFFEPSVFVMENVLGLRSAAGGEYFNRVQSEAREIARSSGRPGYRVHSQIEDARELGIPQKRRRQLIVGVRSDLQGYFPAKLSPVSRTMPGTQLWDAIGDLPVLRAGEGEEERRYDMGRRRKHLQGKQAAKNYLRHILEVEWAQVLTNHVARPHSDRDLRDFKILHEGENSGTAIRARGVKFEFPYKKHHFKDRYTRQSRSAPCSTVVAHLSKDGLMFIHPTQNRSLTPREAARVQSFPDWFRFPRARTHAFRLIGNAVPPVVAEAVGLAVREYLSKARVETAQENTGRHTRPPKSRSDAERELAGMASLNRQDLRALSTRDFVRGWHALLFLFPNLHPDSARDHGEGIEVSSDGQFELPGCRKLMSRRYTRSGWPVALELIGAEALRRYEADELSYEELYSVVAQRAGLAAR
jgi:DNA (cytosine-5)-methyltransferase 1